MRESIELGNLARRNAVSIDPRKFPEEIFELYSIPACDSGVPEIVEGRSIGSAKKIVQPGDVMVSRIAPHIRRSWVVPDNSGKRQIASGEWIVFSGDACHPEYLRQLLVSDPFHAKFMNTVAGVGGSLLRARPAQVYKIKIPFPSLEEQKRIAAILDKADELKAKRQQAIDELDKLQQAVFLDMFGDPDPTWPQLTIAEVALPGGEGMRTGPFGSDLLRSEFVNSGITVLGIDNVSSNHFTAGGGRYITPEKFEILKRYQVSPGDVLISIMGTCGRCAIVPDSIGTAINTKHLCCITLDIAKCLPEYLWSHFLYSHSAKRHLAANTKGAIMAGLNMGIIKRLPIPVPSLELQERYKTALAALTQQKALGNSSLADINDLVGSLQSRAFKGEL